MTAKYCNVCGQETVRKEGAFNFDTETGEPRNHWWSVECPYFIAVGMWDNDHYHDYGDDKKFSPLKDVAFIMVIAMIAIILWLIFIK